MTVPAKFSIASSRQRSVSTSRSFVGSSSMSRLPAFFSVRASCSLFLSPPLREPTFLLWSFPLKLNHEQYARAFISRPPRSTKSTPSLMHSNTVSSAFSSSRLWSTYIGATVSPTFNSPESGDSSSTIIRKRVLFPAPFAPMIPTMLPGGMSRFRLSMSRRSPYAFVRLFAFTTTSPRRGPVGMMMFSRGASRVYFADSETSSS
mmetsp:Transcript_8518/g.19435  ORF Transcript_8518/g.19435 Transcript_8518/m.19435 type:complete len:204 (-) Transcript_8518:69-680(-)